ncbi:C-C motif chemokine 3-like [Gopherus evgoodei]|uniref:C-C motif chemokine n=1 Tax=Gopherus evgoodei TaxID=1825980 RepID=A0A8C4Y7R2_9SAUR|nr:C-C motif chemokine 3-like [Gopherus evgoodei]
MAKATGLVCALLLLASFCCQSLAQKAPGAPYKCCFTFQTSRIKKGNIVGWFLTNPECSYPAVVFKTRMGKEICANPDKRWVKKYQEFFQPNSLSVPS